MDKTMLVGLNAFPFDPGNMGGVEVYFRSLLSHLQAADNTNSYEVLVDSKYICELPLFNSNFGHSAYNYSKPSLGWLIRGVLRNSIRIDILKHILNRSRFDIIHHPFTIANPLGLRIPSVVTFHDMQQEYIPEYFSKKELKMRTGAQRASVAEATRVIAISEYTKDCLVSSYNADPSKIDVIYFGHGLEYRVMNDTEEVIKTREKYFIRKPFLYYPAATWLHKNHKNLFAAVKLMIDRYRFDGELILTGVQKRSQYEILKEIERLGISLTVKVLGYVPSAEMPHLYNLASAMVFPSFFEGFGLPIVEAMACGCPVVCSNVTSCPEVVGDAGIMFDPYSIEDMAEKIWRLWIDEKKKQELRSKGLVRAANFSWENNAMKTVEVYYKAMAQS